MMSAGLAIVASLALAAAGAASASAAEIALTNAAYPQNVVTTDNNPSTLTDGTFITVTCLSLLGKGTLWSPKKILLLVLFHGCHDNLGNPCLSTGQPLGLIHTLLLALPVWLNKSKTLPGILIERHQGNLDLAHFHCYNPSGTILVLVAGEVIAHIPKPSPKVPSHSMELEILTKGGLQEFEKVEEGAEVFKLEVSLNGGPFNAATEEIKKDVLEFENAGVEAEFR
jgi:hypothetical protein